MRTRALPPEIPLVEVLKLRSAWTAAFASASVNLQIVQAAAPNTVCGVPAAQRCRQDAGGPSKPIIDTGLCGNERCENVAGDRFS